MSKYPLCKVLGLNPVDVFDIPGNSKVILAKEVEAILQKATVVYSCTSHKGMACAMWSNDNHPQAHNTHTALLINVRPIKEKTTLEKIMDVIDRGYSENAIGSDVVIQIKKLIEAENENKNKQS